MKNTLQLFVKLKSPRTFEFQWFRAHFNPFCCKTQVIIPYNTAYANTKKP